MTITAVRAEKTYKKFAWILLVVVRAFALIGALIFLLIPEQDYPALRENLTPLLE